MNLRTENTTLRILLKTIAELNLSFERKDISNVVVEGLKNFLNLESSFFYSLDEKREKFFLEACSGDYEEKETVPLGVGFIGYTGQSGEILTVSDTEKGVNNLIIAPVKGKKGLLGVIGGRKTGQPFTNYDKELIHLFASQVGTVMENYIFYHRLQRSKDFRDCILYNIPSGIIIINPDWKVKTYNQSVLAMLGKDTIQKGKNINHVFQNESIYLALKETFAGKGPFKNISFNHKDRQFNVTVVPVKRMALNGDDVMIVLDDITEVKLAYQEKERALRLSQLGQFVAGIAHEIRNPITGITIMLEMLKDNSTLTKKNLQTIDRVLTELNQLEDMVKSMLEITKPRELTLESVNLIKVCSEFLDKIAGIARKRNVNIIFNYSEDDVIALIDKKRFHQILLNLFNNSVESMKNGGDFSININEKEEIEIIVGDTGVGIDDNNIDKIFDPFFTTKQTGTGLGLHITKSTVEQHGGRITVESDGRSWTHFKIYLPRSNKKA